MAGCQSLMFEIHWAVEIMHGYQHNRLTTKYVEMLLYVYSNIHSRSRI